jgi:hypothetical protein
MESPQAVKMRNTHVRFDGSAQDSAATNFGS